MNALTRDSSIERAAKINECREEIVAFFRDLEEKYGISVVDHAFCKHNWHDLKNNLRPIKEPQKRRESQLGL